MENEKKCDKYEAFFVFGDEEAFFEHLKVCPECRREHEKYMKVSSLVKEAAPYYKAKKLKEKSSAVKKLACCMIAFFGLTCFTGYKMYDDYTLSTYSIDSGYDTVNSWLPTDEYGLIEL